MSEPRASVPVPPPEAKRGGRGVLVGAIALAVAVVAIVIVVASRPPSSTTEPPSPPADARVVVEVPPDAAVDATAARPVLVIGELGSVRDLVTRDVLDVIRRRFSASIDKLAPGFSTVLVAEDAREAGKAHRALFLDGTLIGLDVKADAIACKVSMLLASYPEKAVFGFMDGRATVDLGAGKVSAITDCAVKAMEELLVREILPAARARLGS